MKLLDGKRISKELLGDLKKRVSAMSTKPRLEIILVGDDPASRKYVELKQGVGIDLGVEVNLNALAQETPAEEVTSLIKRLNADSAVTGLMVQLPLPEKIDTHAVLESIEPKKDVDGLTSTNLDLLSQNSPSAIAAATPRGVMELLDAYGIEVAGKDVVIVGNTPVVGLPLNAIMLARGAKVTVCHEGTDDLAAATVAVDILISATGKGGLITAEMVKENAVVVDVGLSPNESGKLVGDVDFENVKEKCSYITPVPGGVGPMTVAALFQNLVEIADKKNSQTDNN